MSTVMFEEIDRASALGRINRMVRALGTQAEVARRAAVTRPALTRMLNGERPLHPNLLQLAGLRSVERYEVVAAPAGVAETGNTSSGPAA